MARPAVKPIDRLINVQIKTNDPALTGCSAVSVFIAAFFTEEANEDRGYRDG
jgi:hypothetical protein